MSAGAGGNEDKAIRPGRHRFPCEMYRVHVREHLAAPTMNAAGNRARAAEGRNDERRPVAFEHVHLSAKPAICGMRHHVRRPGCDNSPLRFGGSQRRTDVGQPIVQHVRAARIGGREAADDTAQAGRDDQFLAGHQKHRGCDQRQPQPGGKIFIKRHG